MDRYRAITGMDKLDEGEYTIDPYVKYSDVQELERRAFFLQAFADHKPECDANVMKAQGDCTCGLDELLTDKEV